MSNGILSGDNLIEAGGILAVIVIMLACGAAIIANHMRHDDRDDGA